MQVMATFGTGRKKIMMQAVSSVKKYTPAGSSIR